MEPPVVEVAEASPSGWREAQLDMLLAEELAVSPSFADYFARDALTKAGCPAPGEAPVSAEVRFNVWHEVDDGNHGENDLDITLIWSDGTSRRLLVEDKVWAPLQPTQAERYRARARACAGAAILVAPRRWLENHRQAACLFDADHSLETLACWLREQSAEGGSSRLRWRAQSLEDLAAPRLVGTVLDHERTIAFRDYCVAWLDEHESSAEASLQSLHTENQGWLWFRHPKDLGFKATSGSVDLYVGVNGFIGRTQDLTSRLASLPLPAGFTVTTDTSKRRNVVLRHRVEHFNTADGVPDDTSALDTALDACRRITDWFDHGGARLLRASDAEA